jgi:DNA/RNA-binding domain of Phe-tRNA-synthetase-like protein
MASLFGYEAPIIERYPTVVGGVIQATGVRNGSTEPALASAFATEQAAAIARIGDTSLSDIPSLAAWRRAFRAFGVDPTAYRSAAEALLRRLTKQGSIPSINTLVDIGNLVSIRYALPVAVFDQASVTGGTTVRFATGTESFVDLGSGEYQSPDAGEVVFVDDASLVSARRWCWRQSAGSAAGKATTEILVTVEGHHEGASEDVARARTDLEALIAEYARPRASAGTMLDLDRPTTDALLPPSP